MTITLDPEKSPLLPPELWDIIIDHCSDVLQLLLTCSLVCRSWVPRSRSCLFADRDLEPILVTVPPRYIYRLCTLLGSHHCTLTPYMQRLFFILDLRTDLLHILQGTVFLKKDLKLKALRIASIPPLHSFKPPEFDITGLTSLHMSGSVTFNSTTTRHAVEFISRFTYLESLHLEYSKLGQRIPQALANAESRRRLRPVKVSLPHLRRMNLIVPLDDFLPWLGSARLPSLVYLHIFMSAPPPRDRDHIALLLQSFIDSVCSRSVKDVCIRFMREALPALDFGRCKALRGIRFMEWHHNDIETDFPRLIEIIQSIASPVNVFVSEWPNPPRLDNVRWFIGQHLGKEWQKDPERSEGDMFFPSIALYENDCSSSLFLPT